MKDKHKIYTDSCPLCTVYIARRLTATHTLVWHMLECTETYGTIYKRRAFGSRCTADSLLQAFERQNVQDSA